MALFHYKYEIVPKHYLGDPMPDSIPLTELGTGLNPWLKPPYPDDLFVARLRKLLPYDQSWGETEEYVSSGELGSDLRIWREDGKIGNIEFRYNPECDSWSLMQNFLAIVRAAGYLLIEAKTGAVLLPNEEEVRLRIRGSGE